MKDLLLNPVTGDLAVTLQDADLVSVSGADEVAQQLTIRLRFFLGECIFDPSKGVNYFGKIFIANPNIASISTILKNTILATDGVRDILTFDVSFDKKTRKTTVSFSVDTVYGVVNYNNGLAVPVASSTVYSTEGGHTTPHPVSLKEGASLNDTLLALSGLDDEAGFLYEIDHIHFVKYPFAGNGSALSVSHSDHNHEATAFPTASPTVKGGIKTGSDFTMSGETLQLRHAPLIVSLSGGSVNEKGQTVSSASLSWTLSGDTPTHSSLTDVSGFDVNTAGGVHNFTGFSITTDKTYILTIGDDVENPSSTASVVEHFTQKMYYGNNATSSLTSAQVVALANKFLTDSRLQTLSLSGGGNYLYIAYPSDYGLADIWVGGLRDTSWIQTTVSVTNVSGATEDFYVYRSVNKTSGAGISVEVK